MAEGMTERFGAFTHWIVNTETTIREMIERLWMNSQPFAVLLAEDGSEGLVLCVDQAGWDLLKTNAMEAVTESYATRLDATPAGEVYTTKSGRVLTDSDLDALADEAERGYDVDGLTRRVPEQAEEVPVRLPPQVRAAVERRAESASTSVSEIVRAALWVAGVG